VFLWVFEFAVVPVRGVKYICLLFVVRLNYDSDIEVLFGFEFGCEVAEEGLEGIFEGIDLYDLCFHGRVKYKFRNQYSNIFIK
jgi:hypothetical protein